MCLGHMIRGFPLLRTSVAQRLKSFSKKQSNFQKRLSFTLVLNQRDHCGQRRSLQDGNNQILKVLVRSAF